MPEPEKEIGRTERKRTIPPEFKNQAAGFGISNHPAVAARDIWRGVFCSSSVRPISFFRRAAVFAFFESPTQRLYRTG